MRMILTKRAFNRKLNVIFQFLILNFHIKDLDKQGSGVAQWLVRLLHVQRSIVYISVVALFQFPFDFRLRYLSSLH